MVNRVTLVGRLGKDPESRFTPSGDQVTYFSMATDEVYKDRAGERQKRTEWHTVNVWGKAAENCQQYLKKGALVYVEGKIQTDKWEKNGEAKYATKIVASNVRFLDSKNSAPVAAPAEEPAAEPTPEEEPF